ncbi:HlyD family type I secretion periplasmic adaptor subunit [Azospirillum sp. sgz301742]
MSLAVLRPTPVDEAAVEQAINDFQSDAAEVEGQPEPFLLRTTLYFCVALVVSAIVWATIARIDRVVQSRGKLVSKASSIILQPFDTSILRSINVRAGDVVKAGQLLATLDPTFAEADYGQLSIKRGFLDAQIGRMEAELAGRPYQPAVNLPPEAALAQMALWRSRQAQFQSQVQSYDERIARSVGVISNTERQIASLNIQLQSLKEIEGIRTSLAEKEIGSKINALAAKSSRLDVERNLTIAISTVQQSQHELDDLKAQRDAFIQQWKTTLSQDLMQQRSDRDVLQEQLAKAERRRQFVNLTAPVDAVVLEVANRSVNSIVREAEPLFTLTPLNAPLEVIAQIDGSDIGFVREGDLVHIKFDAYNYMEHGFAEGIVESISDDSFNARSEAGTMTKADSNASSGALGQGGLYYRARIKLTSTDLRNVPANFQLLPGLPLVADIKIGDRSVMGYLVRPLIGSLNESMREP